MLSNLFGLWCFLKEVELIVAGVFPAAISSWRAVACGMSWGSTTGSAGGRGRRCSRTAWPTGSGTSWPCHSVPPTFCSTWTATGRANTSCKLAFLHQFHSPWPEIIFKGEFFFSPRSRSALKCRGMREGKQSIKVEQFVVIMNKRGKGWLLMGEY